MIRRPLARRAAGILALAVLLACPLHPAAVWAADETPDASLQCPDGTLRPPGSLQCGEDRSFGASVTRAARATFDVLFLRPTGLAVLAVGVGLFVPATIVGSPGGMMPVREAWDRFVVQPAGYAFTRPVGEF